MTANNLSTPPGKLDSSQEKTYYQKDSVLVTSHRVIFGEETHVLRNISSVSSVQLPPDRNLGNLIIIISIFMLMCMFTIAFSTNSSVEGILPVSVLGLIGIIVGGVISSKAGVRYAVKLVSGAGETKAVVSKDKEEIAQIVDAINNAIVENN